MSNEIEAILLEDALFSLDELARSCHVSREWIIERVQWGLLRNDDLIGADPDVWIFDSRSFMRIRRIIAVERDFEGNPELAGLVADMIEEIESLRARLKASGLDES
ncbi:chaperone modulator CbpM [Nitrosomonas sp. Is35]|uniref:chaperone modulator CbpM n=1 Tax=unclassified Nitrosomonas TaxID=2609265 RepID=UPI00294B0874|nr:MULTISPECIES: chaperone modulator CbpM [unclassified Nitrosomonas]MDV6342248.1 chaperone modulator CbpM [Nitrosomonas sp. Is24]MDV6348155.1 chaperone modulator CbpM [Nitrosomonas sp. Is35]